VCTVLTACMHLWSDLQCICWHRIFSSLCQSVRGGTGESNVKMEGSKRRSRKNELVQRCQKRPWRRKMRHRNPSGKGRGNNKEVRGQNFADVYVYNALKLHLIPKLSLGVINQSIIILSEQMQKHCSHCTSIWGDITYREMTVKKSKF